MSGGSTRNIVKHQWLASAAVIKDDALPLQRVHCLAVVAEVSFCSLVRLLLTLADWNPDGILPLRHCVKSAKVT